MLNLLLVELALLGLNRPANGVGGSVGSVRVLALDPAVRAETADNLLNESVEEDDVAEPAEGVRSSAADALGLFGVRTVAQTEVNVAACGTGS